MGQREPWNEFDFLIPLHPNFFDNASIKWQIKSMESHFVFV